MNLLVLLAGVADPRYPLPTPLEAAALAAHRARHPQLSPFDEAALECALKLRDADERCAIRALVGAASLQDPLLRHVAGFRLDAVQGLSLAEAPAWDATGLARRLAAWIATLAAPPGLILMGREFGDEDDGVLPGALAEALGWPLIGQALKLEACEGGLQVLRQQGADLERLQHTGPAVLALVNHTGNRLRHPLLKNVMAARKQSFELAALPADPAGHESAGALRCTGLRAVPAPSRGAACRMLDGPLPAQAAAMARELLGEAA